VEGIIQSGLKIYPGFLVFRKTSLSARGFDETLKAPVVCAFYIGFEAAGSSLRERWVRNAFAAHSFSGAAGVSAAEFPEVYLPFAFHVFGKQ
jgi:hypothetical protein